MATKRGGGAVPLGELMKKKAPRYDDEEDEGVNQSESAEQQQQQQQLETELEAIDTVQGELTALEEAQAEDVLQVLRKYAQKKAPIYQQRQQAIDNVPEFWFRTLLAHPTIGEQISDLDQEVFRYLTSLEVVDVEGTQQDYRVNFHFAENEYFSDATLWKEFRFQDDEAQVLSSEITWKDTPQATELQATLVMTLLAQGDDAPEDVQPSFFSIFHKEDRDFALGDMLKGDVWANPLPLYMSVEFKEEGEDGEEGQEGEEEEEGEGEQ